LAENKIDMTNIIYDVIIIGAGLSGIGVACHLTQKKT